MIRTQQRMIKSDNPDLLVIFTKEKRTHRVNQYNAGLGLWMGYDGTLTYGEVAAMSAQQQKNLYIDLMMLRKKELVWKVMWGI
jgi:hypothetical protein